MVECLLLTASCRWYTNLSDVLTVEALAARDGVLLATEREATKVILLEVDNLSVANLIRSEEGIRSGISGIWHEIGELRIGFVAFDVSFVHREGNERLLTSVRVCHRSL